MEQIEGAVEQPRHFVIARSKEEMAKAQDRLVEWFRGKVNEEKAALADLVAAAESAEMNRLSVRGLAAAERRQRHRVVFYGKCLAAVEAGYQIIPNLDIDVFAIRTDKAEPRGQFNESTYTTRPHVNQEPPGRLPAGEGDYRSSVPGVHYGSYQGPEKDGKKPARVYSVETAGFVDPEFPIAVAHPALLSEAREAMALKLFDEIGICPPDRRGDPMLVGRVGYGDGGTRRSMSFLIAWWIDLRSL